MQAGPPSSGSVARFDSSAAVFGCFVLVQFNRTQTFVDVVSNTCEILPSVSFYGIWCTLSIFIPVCVCVRFGAPISVCCVLVITHSVWWKCSVVHTFDKLLSVFTEQNHRVICIQIFHKTLTNFLRGVFANTLLT